MTFVGYNNNAILDQRAEEEDNDDDEVSNWYIDAMLKDLTVDLAEALNISEDSASSKIYTEGLKIYCAMDVDMQDYAEEYVLNLDTPSDPNLQTGIVMMDFNGRVICTVGSREKRRRCSFGTERLTLRFSRVRLSSPQLFTRWRLRREYTTSRRL